MLNTMDYLEREGYAERTPSPADRRARIITVTPAGAALVAAGHEIADRVHREVLDALPEGQREAFTGALTMLVAAAAGRRRRRWSGPCAGRAFRARIIIRLSTFRLSVTVSLTAGSDLGEIHVQQSTPAPPPVRGASPAGARHLVRGVAHGHPRRHDRDRRAARHPGRPRLHRRQPELGDDHLPDRVRRAAAAQRQARRPARPEADVPRRDRGLRRRLARVRARGRPGDADRGPLRPGRGGGDGRPPSPSA